MQNSRLHPRSPKPEFAFKQDAQVIHMHIEHQDEWVPTKNLLQPLIIITK